MGQLSRLNTGSESAPCRIRTCDLVLRRHPLWSTELRGLGTADYKEALLRCDLNPSTGHFVGHADRSPAPTAVSRPDELHQSRAEFGSRDLEGAPVEHRRRHDPEAGELHFPTVH